MPIDPHSEENISDVCAADFAHIEFSSTQDLLTGENSFQRSSPGKALFVATTYSHTWPAIRSPRSPYIQTSCAGFVPSSQRIKRGTTF
jgi:hypothetical protein